MKFQLVVPSWNFNPGWWYNYVDDTAPYACNQNLDHLIDRLQQDSLVSISWFESQYEYFQAEYRQVSEDGLWESSSVELLGIAIDNQ